ncbi:MAG: hypothetical protein AAF938_03970 [Myxococcota bacterium]
MKSCPWRMREFTGVVVPLVVLTLLFLLPCPVSVNAQLNTEPLLVIEGSRHERFSDHMMVSGARTGVVGVTFDTGMTSRAATILGDLRASPSERCARPQASMVDGVRVYRCPRGFAVAVDDRWYRTIPGGALTMMAPWFDELWEESRPFLCEDNYYLWNGSVFRFSLLATNSAGCGVVPLTWVSEPAAQNAPWSHVRGITVSTAGGRVWKVEHEGDLSASYVVFPSPLMSGPEHIGMLVHPHARSSSSPPLCQVVARGDTLYMIGSYRRPLIQVIAVASTPARRQALFRRVNCRR